jgi:sphingomyelin phosphodiesterase acid-like 3
VACWLLLIHPIHSFQISAAPQLRDRGSIISLGKNERTFLILTDIHFDPFSGSTPPIVEALASSPVDKWQSILESSGSHELSVDGADTNYFLLASAIDAARNSGMQYDYILVTGDYLGHEFSKKYRAFRPDGRGYQDFVIKTMVFVNRMIQQSFPDTPIFGALGNNDSDAGDYAAPGKLFLTALSREWKVVAANPDATRDFISGGYYAAPHPTVPSQEFIVLNTSLWSWLFTDGGVRSATTDAGLAEVNWLESRLDEVRAKGHTAALIMHIPPGIDAYASSKGGTCGATTLFFWRKEYMDSFLTIIGNHKQFLRDSYAGHSHINDFRVFKDAGGTPYFQTNIAPSVSPDHHSSEFEIGVYDQGSGALVDYAVVYSKNSPGAGSSGKSDWELAYDFRQLSRFSSYSPASLEVIALLVRSNDAIRSKLLDLFAVHETRAISMSRKGWLPYSCAQTESTPGAFAACSCPPETTHR